MPKSRGEACLELGPDPSTVTWTFQSEGRRTKWGWAEGPQEIKTLEPVRRPQSGSRSKHVPVRAFSTTVGDHIELESGLEHDLVRVLDRDPGVVWIVAQPVKLSWRHSGRRAEKHHTPDLLSVDETDRVTVWDVKRPDATESEEFVLHRVVSEAACRDRGWRYEVFTGLSRIHRHNLMWLHAYRRRPHWAAAYEDGIVADVVRGASLGELVRDSDPQRVSATWHLIWSGRLVVDLTSGLKANTEVTARG